MSKAYDQFKNETIDSSLVIERAKNMRAVSQEYMDGFTAAMWEAREIFMRLEDEYTFVPKDDSVRTLQQNKLT